MRRLRPLSILILALATASGAPVLAQEAALGANVDTLINYAKTRNPEYAAIRSEADAALASAIRQQIRTAFYTDTPAWKQALWTQGLQATQQALAGLAG